VRCSIKLKKEQSVGGAMSVNRRQVIVKFIVKIRDFQYKHSMKLLAEVIDHFQNEKLMFHVFAIKKSIRQNLFISSCSFSEKYTTS